MKKMKKLLTIFAFAATMLSLAAFSSGEPNMVGTWKLTKMIRYASSSDKTGKEDKASTSATDNDFIIANSDGTFKGVYGVSSPTDDPGENSKNNGTYIIKDGKVYVKTTIFLSEEPEDIELEYKFSGDNDLILTYYDKDYKNPGDGYKQELYLVRQ